MPQVFHPPVVFGLKVFLIAALLAIAVVWIALYQALPAHSGPRSAQQPIPFSHKHHVGDDGIDCRYCHSSVEKSAFAGIPSAQVCLTCHSQLYRDAAILAPLRESARTGRPLRWRRVHDLPDFVFFDHSIHLAKGVGFNRAISCAKALLIAVFFMHLRNAGALLRLAALTGVLWLALLFGVSWTDYATRQVSPAPWQGPAQ